MRRVCPRTRVASDPTGAFLARSVSCTSPLLLWQPRGGGRAATPIDNAALSHLNHRLARLEKEVQFLKAQQQHSPEASENSSVEPVAEPPELHDEGVALRLHPDASGDLHNYYALLPESLFNVQTLMKVETAADLTNYAHQLCREVKIRLAHSATNLATAPFGLGHMPSIATLRRWNEISFQDVRELFADKLPQTEAELEQFDSVLRTTVRRHRNTAQLFAAGIHEFAKREGWAEQGKLNTRAFYEEYEDLEYFASSYEESRVKLRFVMEHYLNCSKKILRLKQVADVGSAARDPRYGHDCPFVGAICTRCNMVTLATQAIAKATRDAQDMNLCDVPEIQLKVSGDADFTIPHPPAVSYRVIWACVRDALWACAAKNARDGLPQQPIEVLIVQKQGNSDTTVRVTSTAGGIPHPLLDVAPGYIYSVRRFYQEKPFLDVDIPPAWLPRARAAAKAFGGDFTMASVDGYRVDRLYYLPNQGLMHLAM